MIPNITNCVFGIHKKNEKILLVKNLYKEFGPIWGIPGGKLKPGETLHKGLIREFNEEVSLEIKIGPLLTIFERIQPERPFHLIAPVFEIFTNDKPKIKSKDIVIEFKYFSEDEIKTYPETIMNREQLMTYLNRPEKLNLLSTLPPELDLGPIT